MRAYLLMGPRWVLAVITGLPFGIAMGIYTKIDGPTSWTEAVVGGLVMGVAFGAVMALSTDKQRRTMQEAVADLPASEWKAAHRAAHRGPVPADPEIRTAALRIATSQLDLLRPKRHMIVAMVVLLIYGVLGGLTHSPWDLLYSVTPALMLAGQWYWPQRARRRIKLLSEGAKIAE